MTKPLRTCLTCGELSEGSYCEIHRKAREDERGSAAERGYDAEWRKLVKQAIDAHLRRYGPVCPGWGVPPHTVTKAFLTGDHKIPLSLGGKTEASNIEVMCRSCNSRKGGRNRSGPDGGQTAPNPPPVDPPKKRRGPLIYKYD